MKKLCYGGSEAADTRFHDGALRPVLGACSVQVMRANREHPEMAQGSSFTYNHAPMICRWYGALHLMYLSSPVHEHGGLARALLTRSEDGFRWSKPSVVFPDIAVPPGVYRGKGADKLPPNARTVVHHRMGFYRAPNDVLLVMTHHGVSPDIHIAPNSGYGMGRVVRRIREDGSLGDIFVLRVNREAGWSVEHFPYPYFTQSDDATFVAACRALLADQPANAAWWEEEHLDEDFFPLKGIKAPSLCPMPDGCIAAIGKNGFSSVSDDGGTSWSPVEKAEGVITSTGKCFLTRAGDGRYLMLYNPSPDGQHRWPLAAVTSEDGYAYAGMGCAVGEVAPTRYGGYLKNVGVNYIRGIMPGNDDAPDGYTWAAYSMNKEDIWVLRLPRTVETFERAPVHERFAEMTGPTPKRWYVYSPAWAGVRIEDGYLTLRDSDPYDYAKAVRAFPAAKQVTVSIRVTTRGAENGVLHIELTDAKGMPAARFVLASDRTLRVRAGDGEWPIASFSEGETLELAMKLDLDDQSVTPCLNGKTYKAYPTMCPVLAVERLTLRTGEARLSPTPEDNLKNVCLPDLPNAGERLPEAVYQIASVDVTEHAKG